MNYRKSTKQGKSCFFFFFFKGILTVTNVASSLVTEKHKEFCNVFRILSGGQEFGSSATKPEKTKKKAGNIWLWSKEKFDLSAD